MRRWSMFWTLLFLLGSTLLPVIPPTAAQAQKQPPGMWPKDSRVRPLQELLVSLEWVPSSTPLSEELLLAGCGLVDVPGTYLDDLERGLRGMAGYIYQVTEQKVALRLITIDVTGARWDEADIRVLASQSQRPSAFIGGNATVPMQVSLATDAPDSGGAVPLPKQASLATGAPDLVFRPAPIQVGRFWNGLGARCGPWSQPSGYRTLAHEWGHYALRLYDEYIQYPESMSGIYGNQYCLGAAGQRTLMAYHYVPDVLHPFSRWNRLSLPQAACLNTPQEVVYGQSAWNTLYRFFKTGSPITGYDPFTPDHLMISRSSTLSGPDPITVSLEELSAPAIAHWPAPSYVLSTDAVGRLRMIGQGNLITGQPEGRVWPSWNGTNRLVVTTQEPNSGLVFSYPQSRSSALASPSVPEKLATTPGRWNTAVVIHPMLSATDPLTGAVGLAVELTVCDDTDKRYTGDRFRVTYCPAGGRCLPFLPAPKIAINSLVRRASFAVKPSASGYVYVIDQMRDSEVVLWHQQAGGVGPAHSDGLAPLAEGLVNLDVVAKSAIPSARLNELSYSPELACPAEAKISSSNVRIADLPLRVTLATTTVTTGTVPFWSSTSMGVRINYNEDELDRRGIDESKLVVLQWMNGTWQVCPPLGQDQDLNWIAAKPAGQPGNPTTWTLGGQTLGQDAVVALGYKLP